jgi:predicted ferric reductase
MAQRLMLWSLVVLFPLPLVLMLNLQLTDADGMRFYISLGLVAYCWWLLAVLLSVRPSWLDRAVGLPSVYALHGALGIVAVAVAYVHGENAFAPTRWSARLGEWGFYLALGVLAYSLFFLSGWLTDRSRLLLRLKSRLEVLFRHRVSMWIHRLNLVVVAMIWLHVHLIDRVNQHFAFMVLFDTWTLLVFGVYVWKKWIAPDDYLSGSVRENLSLNGSTRRLSIVLDHPATRSRPGDFYFLRFQSHGIGSEWHPFSATDADRETLTFTIRQNGDFTRQLDGVPPGTRVSLEGPFGRFDAEARRHPENAPLVLIGMGAGVAPLLSLVAGHLAARPIHLLWSVRHGEDAYYGTLLEDYRRIAGDRLSVTTQVGRFRRHQLAVILSPQEIAWGAFFVVGPNQAVLGMQRTLRRIGAPARRIHHERLTL